MTGMGILHAMLSFLCILIAMFFFFRLVSGCQWASHVDAEISWACNDGHWDARHARACRLVFSGPLPLEYACVCGCLAVVDLPPRRAHAEVCAPAGQKTECTLPSNLRSGLMPSISVCMGACATCFC